MKVMMLVHQRLLPPPAPQPRAKVMRSKWRTEYDVRQGLLRLGHEVSLVGVEYSLQPLFTALAKSRPDIVFNLVEEFAGEAIFDQNIVAVLELMKIAYTGCNSRGLAIARDKAISKKIVAHHGVQTPDFFVISRRQRAISVPVKVRFPVIVKYLTEEASFGLSEENVVRNKRELKTQVAKMLEAFEADLLVEEYVPGREIYVGVLGNEMLEVLPPRELYFGRLPAGQPQIASHQLKFSAAYRKRYGIFTRTVSSTEQTLLRRLRETSLLITRALRLNGYVRLDFRMDGRGQIHFIEANPNPQICLNEDFADAAKADGWKYEELLQRILDLGMSWNPNSPSRL